MYYIGCGPVAQAVSRRASTAIAAALLTRPTEMVWVPDLGGVVAEDLEFVLWST